RFIAGVTKHETLIAGAAGIYPHGDIGRLRLNRVQNTAGLRIEAESRIRIADVRNRLPRDLRNIDVTIGRNLSSHYADAGRHQHFTSHAAHRVLREHRVENRVGDLVRHLVRMAFRYRFRCEYVSLHSCPSKVVSSVVSALEWLGRPCRLGCSRIKQTSQCTGPAGSRQSAAVPPPHISSTNGTTPGLLTC